MASTIKHAATPTPAQELSHEKHRADKKLRKQEVKADRQAELQQIREENSKGREEDEKKQGQLLAQLKQSLSTYVRCSTSACGKVCQWMKKTADGTGAAGQ